MPHQLINSLLPYPMVRNETSNVAVLLQGPQKAQLQSFGGLGKAQQGPGEHLNGLQLLGHRGHHGDHGSIEHCGLDSFVYNIDNIYYIYYIYYIYIILDTIGISDLFKNVHIRETQGLATSPQSAGHESAKNKCFFD